MVAPQKECIYPPSAEVSFLRDICVNLTDGDDYQNKLNQKVVVEVVKGTKIMSAPATTARWPRGGGGRPSCSLNGAPCQPACCGACHWWVDGSGDCSANFARKPLWDAGSAKGRGFLPLGG